MRLRTTHLRAILLPVAVAVVSSAALGWYGVVRIPAHQRYLNDRNLRLLKTMSGRIKSKVDNLDQAVDHALDSFQGEESDKDYIGNLQRYVKEFSPDVEVLTEDTEESAARWVRDHAGDPPRVVVQRDEGTNYLYLGYKHGITLVARADIERIVSQYLSAASVFDAVLLVNRDGVVLAQQSPAGLEMARIDGLQERSAAPGAPASGQKPSETQQAQTATFETLRASTNIARVSLGDAEYMLYVQPIALSLNSATQPDPARASKENATPLGERAEEWALCGLVRNERFRSESAVVSYTYLLGFGVLLVGVCLAIPLLKLHLLRPSERLRRTDGIWIAATTFLVAGVLTFCSMDVYYFAVLDRQTTNQLESAAGQIVNRVVEEASAIRAQLDAYDVERVRLGGEHARNTGGKGKETQARIVFDGKSRSFTCDPETACRNAVLAEGSRGDRTYPYFDYIVWSDAEGLQRIKWSTLGNITPFLSLADSKLPYFPAMKSAYNRHATGIAATGVNAVMSPNTGESLTVFWKTVDPDDASIRTDGAPLVGISLSTRLISLSEPVLPQRVRFAVIDATGRVLVHSDPGRSLQENFFLESEDNADLHAAVAAGATSTLNASYEGRRHRMHVRPLRLARQARDAAPIFNDPKWTLVVFQDHTVPETVNLEAFVTAVLLFLVYGAALAAGWMLVSFVPTYRAKWFWPNHAAAAGYRLATLVNIALAAVFLVALVFLESTALLAVTASAAIAGIVATYLLVSPAAPTGDPDWLRDFFGARAALLVVLAVAPAIACFQTAWDFETALLAKSGAASVERQRSGRAERIRTRTARLALCPAGSPRRDYCPAEAEQFTRQRIATAWDLDAPSPASPKSPDAQAAAASPLDALLVWAHRPYNEFAIDLQAAAAGNGAFERLPRTGLVLVIPTIVLALYGLVRIVLRPLFVVDLYTKPGAGPTAASTDPHANVLVIGPPGSGKSARLAAVVAPWVLDARVHGSPGGAAVAEAVAWPGPTLDPFRHTAPATTVAIESFDIALLPADPRAAIGIDHFEHILEEPRPRTEMLQFLEEQIYRHRRRVWIAASCDPIAQLRERGDSQPGELARWVRLLQSFRRENVGLRAHPIDAHGDGVTSDVEALVRAECALTPHLRTFGRDLLGRLPNAAGATTEAVMLHIGDAAAPYYRAVWASCSNAEQLALRQLADEDVVNPRNQTVVAQLMRSGLVVRDPMFRIVNETFRRFVECAMSPDDVAARERDGVSLPWGSITTTLVTVALGLGGLLVLTSQQLVEAWIGYVPALAPAVPTFLKLVTSARGETKTAGAANV